MNYKDKYSLSDHAEQQIRRRGLTHEIVFDVLANPDQEIKLDESKTIYQKIIYWQPESKNYLIRVIVNLEKILSWSLPHIRHPKSTNIMKVKYNKEVDVVSIIFSDEQVEESDENKPGIIMDYDTKGNIVGIEILNASQRMSEVSKFEYEIAD